MIDQEILNYTFIAFMIATIFLFYYLDKWKRWIRDNIFLEEYGMTYDEWYKEQLKKEIIRELKKNERKGGRK